MRMALRNGDRPWPENFFISDVTRFGPANRESRKFPCSASSLRPTTGVTPALRTSYFLILHITSLKKTRRTRDCRYSYTYHNQSHYCPQRTSHRLYFYCQRKSYGYHFSGDSTGHPSDLKALVIRAPPFPRLLLLIAALVRVSIKIMI